MQAVVAHLVNDHGLQLDLDTVQEAERSSALQNRAEAECHSALQNPAGRIVFIYRKTVPPRRCAMTNPHSTKSQLRETRRSRLQL